MNSGDIIYTPFPFTDLSSSKIRPALVLYKDETDALVAYIISKNSSLHINTTVTVFPNDENGLRQISYIRVEKLLSIEQKIVWGILGKAGQKVFDEVVQKLISLLKQ